MAAKIVIPSVRHVYRIPTKEVYRRNHIKGDPSWQDVYGKARCDKCRKHFVEGDVYEMTRQGKPQHIDCPK